MSLDRCPNGHALSGLATYCHQCASYVADMLGGTEQLEAKPEPNVLFPDRSEEEIRHAIKAAVERIGGVTYDTEQQRKDTRVTAGVPDLIVAFPRLGNGAWSFVEVKSATGRLRDSQEAFRRALTACGAPYAVWRDEMEALRFWREHGGPEVA